MENLNTNNGQLLNDIYVILGKMEVKQNNLCDSVRELKDINREMTRKIDNMPCEEHIKYFDNQLAAKVSTKLFMWVVGILTFLVVGAYGTTARLEHDLHSHELSAKSVYPYIDPNTKPIEPLEEK